MRRRASIADNMSEKSCDVHALAAACGVKASPLLRVLHALVQCFDLLRT